MNSSSDSDDEFFDAKESPLEEKPPFDIKRVPLVASRQNSPTKPIRHVLKSQVSADDSPFSRQRKLNYLREKMRSEFDGDVSENIHSRAENSGLGYGGITTDSLDSSNSELSSLASWSKQLLMSDNSKQSENIVVKPLDTVSTKAAVLPSAASDNNFPIKFPPPPTVAPATAVHRQTVVVVTDCAQTKFSSSSTESSKNSTMERFETPESKSSSLERNMQISRSLSSKTGSLTREMNSIGACEQFLYDNDQLADLERKNSAAAEVVEALTSELVRNVKSERNLLQRSVESLLPVEETDLADGASVVVPKFVPPTESPVKKPHKEPDIITSNRVRAAELTLDLNGAPVKPPRRKNRLGSSDTASSSVSSPLVSPGVGITITDSDTTSTRPFDLHNEDDVLDRTIVKNLDTGEQMPLSVVDERLPKCDPLTLHIMRLTSDFPHKHSVDSLDSDTESFVSEDTRSVKSFESRDSYFSQAKQKTSQYKKLLGKTVVKAMSKTANKVRKAADGVSHHFHKEETSQSEDEENSDNNKTIRIRASHKHKGPYHFEQVKLAQDLTGEHSGAVWCLKFSHCGRLLATAGQDNQIRIWVLKDAFNYFNDMRSRYNAEEATVPFQEQLLKCAAEVALTKDSRKCSLGLSTDNSDSSSLETAPSARASVNQDDVWAPFMPKPFCVYRGHSADVLDLSWSKNYFILSSSMDRTVRLWHISRTECLCCFQHIDFVTAIAFLPKDDRYFLSGSLDGKLRLWHIPEKKVALWNEVDGGKLVTTLTFARNGKFAVVGTYDGRCIVYSTEQLKYHTQIDVKSSHGKNSRPHKVTGLDSYQDKLLVTSNDSRIRLYDLRDLSLTCKYKGYTNYSSQIRASFNHNGKYIVCGSEDKNIYLWKTTMDSDTLSLPVRKDRNRMWESVRAHNAVVTAVVFTPRPELIFQQIEWAKKRLVADCASIRSSSSTGTNKNSPSKDSDTAYSGEVFVSADFTGAVHVFINKAKVKTGSSTFMPSY